MRNAAKNASACGKAGEAFGMIAIEVLIHIEQPVFVICCALCDLDAEMVKDRAGSVHVDPAPVQFVRIEDGMSYAGRVVEDEIGRFGVLAVANADHPMPLGEVGFRIRGVVIAAILRGRPGLQRHQNGMSSSQLLQQVIQG